MICCSIYTIYNSIINTIMSIFSLVFNKMHHSNN